MRPGPAWTRPAPVKLITNLRSIMPQISNDYSRVELLKLTTEPGASGPLIALQRGYAPGDPTFNESVFMLRRDGKWVDFVALGAAGKPELWDETLFDKPVQVLNLLNTHKMDAEVHALDVAPEALASWLSRTAGFTAQQRIDNLVNLHKERLRTKKS
jgi:hypothetical protein